MLDIVELTANEFQKQTNCVLEVKIENEIPLSGNDFEYASKLFPHKNNELSTKKQMISTISTLMETKRGLLNE